MNQMTRQYNSLGVNKFRNPDCRPWHVRMIGEQGIDAGGPARELVTEIALDLMCPLCGLVTPIPNAVNQIGTLRDYMIPVPNPLQNNRIMDQYKFAGAFIAICVRTGLVQQLNFPPLVWNYLMTGNITIEEIYEIDENYKILIQSLQEAKQTLSNAEFNSRFQLKFVIKNAYGKEMPLNARGKTTAVTLSNCSEFISLSNEFRLNELKPYLEKMRAGLWENFGCSAPKYLNWIDLEFLACGEKEISLTTLRKVTQFLDIQRQQQEWFWEVVEGFTPEQLSKLLRFSTGRVRLPPQIRDGDHFLIIDGIGTRDMLPTSSTCFHKLHMPPYSSFEKMKQMISVAIEFTGTFENE
ncbi:putative E3 ubiquitin-protein ligase HERC1 [Histomonas meleagridis]|uniref:putative E3 ubiquitin-protein ligase HERC1 n=1 Tax=Histomonas meleagridis TaxID=135588 RepID=UPI00355A8C25|nr:putative E3 ubiquitin-protein ligase HERC1 [Histomonas meleagridis]KAH0799205.1 putative E3 ubiquitin-protein ligase HERC1 [Histomonas meleagridis]